MEIAEIPDHPWYVAVQFHPEFKSKPLAPHPLFADFVRASLENRRARGRAGSRRRVTCSSRWRRLEAGGVRAWAASGPAVRPALPDRRPVRDREPAHPGRGGRAPQGHHGRRSGMPVRLQGQLRQGQPLQRLGSFRGPGMERGPRDPGRRAARATACPSSPTSTRWRRSRRWPRSRTCCRSRRSSAARPDLVFGGRAQQAAS